MFQPRRSHHLVTPPFSSLSHLIYSLLFFFLLLFFSINTRLFSWCLIHFPSSAHFSASSVFFVLPLVPRWIWFSYVNWMAFSTDSCPSSSNGWFFSPLDGSSPVSFTFNTSFLFHDPPAAVRCYQYASRHIHGLSISLPGLPYAKRTEAVTAYLWHKAFTFLEDHGHSSQDRPRILILTKGEQKVHILWELIDINGVLDSLAIEDLQDYSCPSATSLIGCRSSTRARAAVFAAWIKGRFKEGLADTAPATDL